jgi:hypothetical protein
LGVNVPRLGTLARCLCGLPRNLLKTTSVLVCRGYSAHTAHWSVCQSISSISARARISSRSPWFMITPSLSVRTGDSGRAHVLRSW